MCRLPDYVLVYRLLPYYLGDDDKAVAHAKGVMAASYLDAPAAAVYRKSQAKALVARLLADCDGLAGDV
jgi:hypothetical protein